MPNPGDPKAQAHGCTCPSEPNQAGQGTFSMQADSSTTHYLVAEHCPLHGKSNWREQQ